MNSIRLLFAALLLTLALTALAAISLLSSSQNQQMIAYNPSAAYADYAAYHQQTDSIVAAPTA